MNLLHHILNLVGLLLWIRWRSLKHSAPLHPGGPFLVSPLQQVVPNRLRWMLLLGIGLLIVGRAAFYRMAGPGLNWLPSLSPGAIEIEIFFRSDLFPRMLLYSFLSFLTVLLLYVFSLLYLSLINRDLTDAEPYQKALRHQLGFLAGLPGFIRFFLPLLLAGAAWALIRLGLGRLDLIPAANSPVQILLESLLVGVGSYFTWLYLMAAILFVHVVTSYVYFGNFGLLAYLNLSSRKVTPLFQWLPFLKYGTVDLTPVAGMAILFLATEYGSLGLTVLFKRVFEIPIG